MSEADTASIRIAKPPADVFAFMANPNQMSLWSFGTWTTQIDKTGLIEGRSIKDGALIYLRIDAHPATRLVDYWIGTDSDQMRPRIFARVLEGPVGDSLLLLTALRAPEMDEDRWRTLKATHIFELSLIKAALETGYDHRKATS